MKWFVYLVRCRDGSIYTGITNDVKKRLAKHNSKKGAKALLGKLPVELVHTEEYEDKTIAAKREREIKRWRSEKKLNLIRGLSQVKQTRGLPRGTK